MEQENQNEHKLSNRKGNGRLPTFLLIGRKIYTRKNGV